MNIERIEDRDKFPHKSICSLVEFLSGYRDRSNDFIIRERHDLFCPYDKIVYLERTSASGAKNIKRLVKIPSSVFKTVTYEDHVYVQEGLLRPNHPNQFNIMCSAGEDNGITLIMHNSFDGVNQGYFFTLGPGRLAELKTNYIHLFVKENNEVGYCTVESRDHFGNLICQAELEIENFLNNFDFTFFDDNTAKEFLNTSLGKIRGSINNKRFNVYTNNLLKIHAKESLVTYKKKSASSGEFNE